MQEYELERLAAWAGSSNRAQAGGGGAMGAPKADLGQPLFRLGLLAERLLIGQRPLASVFARPCRLAVDRQPLEIVLVRADSLLGDLDQKQLLIQGTARWG